MTMLHLAEAGVEHAREVLRTRNATSGDPTLFTDELSIIVGNNGTIDGYANGTDDLPLIGLTASPLGSANGSYTVYLTNDVMDGRNHPIDTNGHVTLTSITTKPTGAQRVVEIEVTRNFGPPIKAAIYAQDQVTIDGATGLLVDGYDNCLVKTPKPPIYTLIPAITDRKPLSNLRGAPEAPQQGPEDIDIPAHLGNLKVGSPSVTIITQDQTGQSFGDASHYVTVYSDTSNPPNPQGLRVLNGVGYGLLLVEGDLTLRGGFGWSGLILVTGNLTLDGGGGNVNIRGAVLAQGTVEVKGSVDARYDSCQVNQALNHQSLNVVSWKEHY